jgi:hypothetical protein
MPAEPRQSALRPPHRSPQQLVAALRHLEVDADDPRPLPADEPTEIEAGGPGDVGALSTAARRAALGAQVVAVAAQLAPAPQSPGPTLMPTTLLEPVPTPEALRGQSRSETGRERPSSETPPPVAREPRADRPAALAPEPRRRAPDVDPPFARSATGHGRGPDSRPGGLARRIGGSTLLGFAARLGLAGAAVALVLVVVVFGLGGASGRPAPQASAAITPASTTIPAPAAPPRARHRHRHRARAGRARAHRARHGARRHRTRRA